MGRTPPRQKAALDVLDWLHFNQVLVYAVYDNAHVALLAKIVAHVKAAAAEAGAVGIEAELMKHYVFCFLEIVLTDERAGDANCHAFQQVAHFNKVFFMAMMSANVTAVRGDFPAVTLAIVDTISNELMTLPAVLRFRLAERCLALEYPNAAHESFVWFVRAQVLPCSKYRVASMPRAFHAAIVTRVGLLCEFELARLSMRQARKGKSVAEQLFDAIAGTQSGLNKILVQQAGQLWSDNLYGAPLLRGEEISLLAFSVPQALDSDYVAGFLENLHGRWRRPRLYEGTAAAWPAILGAFHIVLALCNDDENERSGPRRTLHNEENNQGTLSSEASDAMARHGVVILGRPLVQRYREFEQQYRPRIAAYYADLNACEWVMPADQDDLWYLRLHATGYRAASADVPITTRWSEKRASGT